MVEIIERKVRDLLERKRVSLAMIYDMDGNILWHEGRDITGKTIQEGGGVSKTYIRESFVNDDIRKTGGFIISANDDNTTHSIIGLVLKSLLISQISDDYFLYIDSRDAECFNSADREVFQVLGEMVGDTIPHIREQETDTGGTARTGAAVEETRDLIMTYAKVDDPLLITGETGTGKTYIAEFIHNYSGKKGKFVVVNTPGIPESLFESELFGYKKGAFTNAAGDKKGLVEEAAGGTLLIDEITEVSMPLQAKLLRFIETGKYTRLGEPCEREVNTRIIAATNKDLQNAIEKKEFREDLYYRLNVFEIHLPPLRERKEDIRALVMEKIKYLNGKKTGCGTISKAVKASGKR